MDEHWRLWPHTFASVLSQGKWSMWPYLSHVGRTIANKVYAKKGGMVMVFAPPRHGKTEFISHWLPAWFLSVFPEKNVILASYSGDLAAGNGRKVRNTLDEHESITGVAVASDSSAADRWHTTGGGSMRSVGIGGTITGLGAHLFIIDDPVKDAEEADSETIRNKHWDWWQSVAMTRREPGCVTIVLQTRWHEDDLSGRILSTPQYLVNAEVISLPALAVEDDPVQRQIGDPLCPDRFSREELLGVKSAMSPRWWNALYQQSPTAAEGSEIKRQWWLWYDELPVRTGMMDFVCLSVDCSFRDTDGSDFVVIQCWAAYGGYRYFVDQVRDRLDFQATVEAIRSMAKQHSPHAVLIEAKANGDAVINMLVADMPNVVAIEPLGGKESRVRAIAPQVASGAVVLPKNHAGAKELVEEASAFPLGRHDDMVDAMSQALNFMLSMNAEKADSVISNENHFVSKEIQDRLTPKKMFKIRESIRKSI